MNRNNFLIHLTLASVLILVAAFAGQLRKWQKHWHMRPTPVITRTFHCSDRDLLTRLQHQGTPEVLVRFRPGTTREAIETITARLHDRLEDSIESVDGLTVIDDLDDADSQVVADTYSSFPEVEYAEPNYEVTFYHSGGGHEHRHANDPLLPQQWALANDGSLGGKENADISATQAWVTTTGSEEIVVAVLDSGVDYTHPDLKHNIWNRPDGIAEYEDRELGVINDLHGYNAMQNSGDPMDENGHGTHCAGIIGAEGENNIGIAGINWNVKIMPLKFMDAGGVGTTQAAVEAINYVIQRKRAGVNVRVISASWGSRQKSRALEDIIRQASQEGILFVAASGNSHSNNDRSPQYPASYNLPNVLSVAALNRQDELANFSNFGPKSVHIAAPGAEILSTWLHDEYEVHSGTSMATPMVAGVAALVLSKYPEMSVEELRSRLLNSVDKIPSLQGKVVSEGRIDAAKAVNGH